MTVSRNVLVYNYAVMRCKESQFLALDGGLYQDNNKHSFLPLVTEILSYFHSHLNH